MGLIETLLVLILLLMLLQLLFSFIPGLDHRIVTIIAIILVLAYVFGWRMHIPWH